MLRLEDIKPGALNQWLEHGEVVRVVTSEPIGPNALTVYYKKNNGSLLERLICRTDEMNLALAVSGRPWSFDAPGADFKLAVEACRINLAYLHFQYSAINVSLLPFHPQCSEIIENLQVQESDFLDLYV